MAQASLILNAVKNGVDIIGSAVDVFEKIRRYYFGTDDEKLIDRTTMLAAIAEQQAKLNGYKLSTLTSQQQYEILSTGYSKDAQILEQKSDKNTKVGEELQTEFNTTPEGREINQNIGKIKKVTESNRAKIDDTQTGNNLAQELNKAAPEYREYDRQAGLRTKEAEKIEADRKVTKGNNDLAQEQFRSSEEYRKLLEQAELAQQKGKVFKSINDAYVTNGANGSQNKVILAGPPNNSSDVYYQSSGIAAGTPIITAGAPSKISTRVLANQGAPKLTPGPGLGVAQSHQVEDRGVKGLKKGLDSLGAAVKQYEDYNLKIKADGEITKKEATASASRAVKLDNKIDDAIALAEHNGDTATATKLKLINRKLANDLKQLELDKANVAGNLEIFKRAAKKLEEEQKPIKEKAETDAKEKSAKEKEDKQTQKEIAREKQRQLYKEQNESLREALVKANAELKKAQKSKDDSEISRVEAKIKNIKASQGRIKLIQVKYKK
jgi:hypothetical protein